MSLPFNVRSRPLLPELSELYDGFYTLPRRNLPALAGLRADFDSHLLRLEDEMKEGLYEVRAKLPGVDPTDGIEVTVRDGGLVKSRPSAPRRAGPMDTRSSRTANLCGQWRSPPSTTRTEHRTPPTTGHPHGISVRAPKIARPRSA